MLENTRVKNKTLKINTNNHNSNENMQIQTEPAHGDIETRKTALLTHAINNSMITINKWQGNTI